MYIVTYSRRLLTFSCNTKADAKKLLAACIKDEEENFPGAGGGEDSPNIMTEQEYLDAICEDSLSNAVFGNPRECGLG